NYAKDITLAELADYVGYSHSHFSKVFKEEMGCGFRVYLNELRVEKSKSLLLAGVASLSEICSMCGFEDQSYYCKVFKKVTGVTPDKFRKQGRHIDNNKEYGL
ncbi:MAG: helix-turn-helix transcriptional regulator, partial [Oscillospiraceae bacterium]|nr:helix-turn-helix transcriptional regulator [Oscillospiraceae bacterium]